MTERYVGVAAGLLIVLGAFLPWVKVQTIFGSLSVNGVDNSGDGIITLAAGLIGALVLWKAVPWAWMALAAGIITVGIGVLDMSDASERAADVNNDAGGMARASIGSGLYLTVGAGILLSIMAGVVLQAERAAKRVASTTSGPVDPRDPPFPPPVQESQAT